MVLDDSFYIKLLKMPIILEMCPPFLFPGGWFFFGGGGIGCGKE